MNSVNKTLYIPLYGKAYVSQKGLFLADKKAEEIWAKAGFKLKGKARSKWLAYYMGIRSAVFDAWAKDRLAEAPSATVLHLGCGLDSRAFRIGTQNKWYDADLPEVIDERKLYFEQSENYQLLSCDISDIGWLESIPEGKDAIVIMEGVSMYIDTPALQALTVALSAHFERVWLLMDCYTELACKMSKYKNPVNQVGVTRFHGIDDPEILSSEHFTFIKEHDMTPPCFTDKLKGMEKHVFKKLYAGGISKKLYKLFEYKSV